MQIDNPFPLLIAEKVNTPQILAALAQFGDTKIVSAEDVNKIVNALNYLKENSSPAINQNNKNLFVDFITDLDSNLIIDRLSKINALAIVVDEYQTLKFRNFASKTITTDLEEYFVLYSEIYDTSGLGKGTYGLGGTPIVATDLVLIFSSLTTASDVESNPENQVIIIPTLGSQTIQQYVTAKNPPYVIQSESVRMFKITDTGKSYIFTAVGGTYGVGGLPAAANDFVLIPNTPTAITNISQLINDVGYMTTHAVQIVSGEKTFLFGMLGLRNLANTFTSYIKNLNTASRTYTLQNRDGTFADLADIATLTAGKMNTPAGTTNYLSKFLNATTIGLSRLFDNGTYFGIGTEFAPTKDFTLGNQENRQIGVEQSTSANKGRDLTISAGRTVNFSVNNTLISTGIIKPWASAFSDNANNVYFPTWTNVLYKIPSGSSSLEPVATPGVTTTVAGCVTPSGDIYIASLNGSIYKQTGGTGSFVAQTSPSISWFSMCATPNGDVYATVVSGHPAFGGATGDIYKQTNGTGSFVAMGFSAQSYSIASNSLGDVYVAVKGGTIYVILAGTSTLTNLMQTARDWNGIAVMSNGDVYATVQFGDLYVRQGSGNFIATGQTSQTFTALTISSGNVLYVGAAYNQPLYSLDLNSIGTANLDGGTLINKAGTGKGTGKSRYEIWTGQKTVSGTDMQIETLREYIDENGHHIHTAMPVFADNAAALAGGLPVGCEYRTATGINMIVF